VHTLVHSDDRGTGLSDWDVEDLSFEAWVRDLEAVVEAAGVTQFRPNLELSFATLMPFKASLETIPTVKVCAVFWSRER